MTATLLLQNMMCSESFKELPEVRVCVRHLEHPDATPQSAAVHGAAQLPRVGLLIVNLYGLEVCRAIEASNRK